MNINECMEEDERTPVAGKVRKKFYIQDGNGLLPMAQSLQPSTFSGWTLMEPRLSLQTWFYLQG